MSMDAVESTVWMFQIETNFAILVAIRNLECLSQVVTSDSRVIH